LTSFFINESFYFWYSGLSIAFLSASVRNLFIEATLSSSSASSVESFAAF
jgi:hypothetical protein